MDPRNVITRALGVIHLCGALLVCGAAFAAQSSTNGLLKGQAALSGDFSTDTPGVRRLITVNDLPIPYATKSVDNGPHMVPRPEGAMPKAPLGFVVDLLAANLDNPRKIVTAPNGDLFIAEAGPGRIKILRQGPDGKIISTNIFAEHLRMPFGIAFFPPGNHPKFVYVANTDSVVRYPYASGDLAATGPEEMIVPDIPGGGHLRGGGHWTRDIVFTRDGKKMFVSVGSHSNGNDDEFEKNRADILQYNPDGTGFRIYASGIRNPVGLAIDSRTGNLWTSVNERDNLGDNLPPDYITRVKENGFYGWPWFYLGNHLDPTHANKHPDVGAKTIVPDVLLQAHSASLCLTFYTATQFPKDFHGGIFAAEHGSWNRERRTGYKVIFVPLKRGKATGEYDDFLTGFVNQNGEVWGRPVGVTVDSQGSLIVADDGSNNIWRVRYTGASAP